MEIKVRVEIAQKPENVWSTLMDLERWPEWTRSITSIQRLDSAPLAIGSQLRIRQPKLKALVWRVSDFVQGRIIAWEARSPGLFVHARHEIQSMGSSSRVILTIHQTGWLSPLVNFLFGKLTREYVEMEAKGLKHRCESESP